MLKKGICSGLFSYFLYRITPINSRKCLQLLPRMWSSGRDVPKPRGCSSAAAGGTNISSSSRGQRGRREPFPLSLNSGKRKQLTTERTDRGCFHMGKPKKRWKRNRFGDRCCQQQLSHPDCSSESLHCILTTNPTLCLEKRSGDMTEIYIGIFRAWMGTTADFCL